jgi:hypothetical protein
MILCFVRLSHIGAFQTKLLTSPFVYTWNIGSKWPLAANPRIQECPSFSSIVSRNCSRSSGGIGLKKELESWPGLTIRRANAKRFGVVHDTNRCNEINETE